MKADNRRNKLNENGESSHHQQQPAWQRKLSESWRKQKMTAAKWRK